MHLLARLAAVALLALVAPGPAAGEAAADELRVLTYNTHGLPGWVAGDAPDRRFPEIAARILGYDVALLQEDFAHHEHIRRAAEGRTLVRGNGRQPLCPICSGSGLTALVRPGTVEEVEETEQGVYEACAGWLGGANDCFASKGFLRVRLRLGSGARVDVVDTHLDAGRELADREARAAQLEHLARALEANAAGRALIVAGDLNLDAHDPADRRLLARFARRLGLRDAGARPRAGKGWPVLDYVLWRSGDGARLELLEADEDAGFVHDGQPLSDHPALFVRFRVRPASDEEAGPPLSASSTSPRPPGSPHR